MHIKPEILKRKTVAKSRLFQVDEMHMRFSNGEERMYEKLCARGYGAVLVVPMLDEDTVLLIREYGAGIGDYHLSLPKGAVDPGEALEVAANRELMEEVGYGARQMTELKRLYLSPGYMENGINIFLAQDLYQQRLQGDEPEPIEVVPYPLSQLSVLIARADFCEGRALAALFLAREHLSRG